MRRIAGASDSIPKDTDPKHPTESWLAEMKFAAAAECASLSEIELGECRRRKGLPPEQIAT